VLGKNPHGSRPIAWRLSDYENYRFFPFGGCGRDGAVRCRHKCPAEILKMRSLLKILLLAVAGLLVSCTFSEYPFGNVLPYGGVTSLPSGYTGNAYFWNGSYYTGGRYETGRFHYIDRFYNNRYMFNGRYLYGGSQQYIQGVNAYPGRGFYSNQRYYNKHRYYQPFHRHLYH
jgi:hypothetical protein